MAASTSPPTCTGSAWQCARKTRLRPRSFPCRISPDRDFQPGADFEIVPFDELAGKHGAAIGGEREAARALMRGQADAACMIDSNHLAFIQEGTLTSSATRILARTPAYDHCNFTLLDDAPPDLIERFRELMLGMT